MVEYSTIEEAWAGSAPPPNYVTTDPLFDVAKNHPPSNDGYAHTNRASEPEQASALESAFPGSEPYQRMYGTRSPATLQYHAPRPDGCDTAPVGRDHDHDAVSQRHDHGPRARRAHKDERESLHDLLLFALFGLLMVLAMHEVASLGAMLGRRGIV